MYKLLILYTYYSRHTYTVYVKKVLVPKIPIDGSVQLDICWKDRKTHFIYILFERTKHWWFVKELIYAENVAQCGFPFWSCKICSHLVQLRIVTDRLRCVSHPEWYLLSNLPKLPDIFGKGDFLSVRKAINHTD